MRTLASVIALVCAGVASAQSLTFYSGGEIPWRQLDNRFDGRLREARVDVIRSQPDWESYTGAQTGFGGARVGTLLRPDFCRQQVIAINLGTERAWMRRVYVTSVRPRDSFTWEIRVKIDALDGAAEDVPTFLSPYVTVLTPLGPDDYVVVFDTPEGRDIVELRSPPRLYVAPVDPWGERRGRGR